MTTTIVSARERLLDLLADRALVGLEPQEADELARLLVDFPEAEALARDIELAAAAVAIAAVAWRGMHPLPDAILTKVEESAQDGMPTTVNRLPHIVAAAAAATRKPRPSDPTTSMPLEELTADLTGAPRAPLVPRIDGPRPGTGTQKTAAVTLGQARPRPSQTDVAALPAESTGATELKRVAVDPPEDASITTQAPVVSAPSEGEPLLTALRESRSLPTAEDAKVTAPPPASSRGAVPPGASQKITAPAPPAPWPLDDDSSVTVRGDVKSVLEPPAITQVPPPKPLATAPPPPLRPPPQPTRSTGTLPPPDDHANGDPLKRTMHMRSRPRLPASLPVPHPPPPSAPVPNIVLPKATPTLESPVAPGPMEPPAPGSTPNVPVFTPPLRAHPASVPVQPVAQSPLHPALSGAPGLVPHSPPVAPMLPSPPGLRVVAIAGWAAAAVLLVLIGVIWFVRPKPEVITVTEPAPPLPVVAPTASTVPPATEREKLLARPGSMRMEWTRTKDVNARQSTGDIVWNAADQRGFVRLRGLAPNEKKTNVYQLFIIDKTRDDRFPVDGGIFEVDDENAEILIPFTPKLEVGDATLFFVALEKAGGVVVTKRERVILTASAKP